MKRPGRSLGATHFALAALMACSPSPRERAEIALREGDFQVAFRLAYEATRAEPESGEVQLLLARACLVTKRTSTGAPAARRAAELLPRDPNAHLVKARLLAPRRQYLAALAAATEATRLDPTRVTARLVLGELWLQGGRGAAADHAAAEAEFREAVRLDPASARARFDLGKVLVLTGEHEEGARELDTFLSSGFDFSEAVQLRGVARTRRRDLEGAERDFRRAIELDPARSEPYFHLAHVLYRKGNREEADRLRDRHQAVKEREEFVAGAWLLYHLESGDVNTALELARSLGEEGRHGEAVELLETLAADRPRMARVHAALAATALDIELFELAAPSVEALLRLAPDSADAHRLAARLARANDRGEDAVSHLREANRLAPDQLAVRLELAAALVDLENADEAIAVLDEARATPDPRWKAGMAAALLVGGRPHEAEPLLTAALEQRPRRYRWWHDRGRARWEMSRRREAEVDFRRAIAIAPHFTPAYEALVSSLRADARDEEAEEIERRRREIHDRQATIARLRRAVRRRPEDLATATRLAVLLEEDGRPAEAGRVRARSLGVGESG